MYTTSIFIKNKNKLFKANTETPFLLQLFPSLPNLHQFSIKVQYCHLGNQVPSTLQVPFHTTLVYKSCSPTILDSLLSSGTVIALPSLCVSVDVLTFSLIQMDPFHSSGFYSNPILSPENFFSPEVKLIVTYGGYKRLGAEGKEEMWIKGNKISVIR